MKSSFRRVRSPLRLERDSKLAYFTKAVLRGAVPPVLCRRWLAARLAAIDDRPDRDEILARAHYCCKLDPESAPRDPDPESLRIRDFHLPWKKQTYYFDAKEALRYFDPDLRFRFLPGDNILVPDTPALVKSRPIVPDDTNANAVLLKLNKVRHFVFVDHDIPFEHKSDTLLFRGNVYVEQPHRVLFFEKHFGAPSIDIGDTSKRPSRIEWAAPRMTIEEQLRHKFILSLEGNDVASNLKWIFSSNSIVVMPRPRFETWFQEGLLVPGLHYIEIARDYSNLQEQLAFYRARPDLCEQINAAEHAWSARFRDPERERLVALKVMERYFAATNPTGKHAPR